MGRRNEPSEAAGGLAAVLAATEPYAALARAVAGIPTTCVAGGVTPCGAALLATALLGEATGRSALLVAPSQEEAEDVYAAAVTFRRPPRAVAFFPATEKGVAGDADPATVSGRLGVCRQLLARTEQVLVIAPVQAVLEEVPSPDELGDAAVNLTAGQRLDPEALTARLADRGFKRLVQVERPGDFARRGGILDVFPFGRSFPVRLEFDGEELSSVREFDPVSQRSRDRLSAVEFAVEAAAAASTIFKRKDRTIVAYLGRDDIVGLIEEPEMREKAIQLCFHAGLATGIAARRVDELFALPHVKLTRFAPPESCAVFPFTRRPPMGDSIETTASLLRGYLTLGASYAIFCSNDGDRDRLSGLFADKGVGRLPGLAILRGDVREGFTVSEGAAVVSSREILGRTQVRRAGPLAGFARPGRGFFSLGTGDLVVHVAHGIGKFLGTEWVERDGLRREFLVLEYRDGVKLFVPVTKADLVAKYVGTSEAMPRLDKVSSSSWLKRCESVERAVHDLASELLDIQARRVESPGFPFPPDDEWQRQLEASFSFEDTPDQAEATRAVKRDMLAARCMDRLLCGDVGYGKTEVAVRAAFKAVCAGRQVAILVPTTVLAEQHYETFCDRMSAFPVTIEVLSRFRSKAEQKAVLDKLGEHAVDVVIGTHRLLSADVSFADLGLVIIDEEQRFGVAHKERFKRMRALVDVLTMTATPIPRTLHMALLGLRDISNLTTPPEGRAPVHTEVCRFDPALIRASILREIDRDGQVYFVHNRIQGLARLRVRLGEIAPEARIAIAHGQLPERELALTMHRFLRREVDVLITTTIIESGLDIPNVNTIFVSEADTFGLADLHQLRGRVGRFRHQAYAYFLVPESRPVNRDGEKRLRAVEAFQELGAGFQIALKDLELRGAGNILGPQQSGHIAQVGYEMYCRLLKKAVGTMRKERVPSFEDVEVGLAVAGYLPEEYVPAGLDRIELYRRLTGTRNEEDLAAEETELRDRFGSVPPPAQTLLDLQRLRIRLGFLHVRSTARAGDRTLVRTGSRFGPELAALSPQPLREVDSGAFVIERPVADDGEAFKLLLAWSSELLRRAEALPELARAT